jgi:hypothetical protein
MLERWLAARDADTLRSAWTALAPRRHVVTQPPRHVTAYGAALLAQAMLGERPDWILERWPRNPDYHSDNVVGACFVDDAWDMGRCHEIWDLWERRTGTRGIQVVSVGCGTVEGRPEGGSQTVVRVFDHDRAASILLESQRVSTIGEIDLAPLDLFSHSDYFGPVEPSIEMLRGLVAQVAGEVDAHYDTSTAWQPTTPGAMTFADGERSIEIAKDAYNKLTATVHGLPWGHQIAMSITATGSQGYAWVRLPTADIDRLFARLATIGKHG